MSIYDYKVKSMDGTEVSMADYKGKVLLIVNTATGCGFTPQYKGLQELYEKYNGQGFEILDFPCNQFLGQAPGTNDEIHTFCTGRFGIKFPQFGKINVNGPKTEPLFQYLKEEAPGSIGPAVKWNFTKFLVNKEGKVLRRFAPTDTPEQIESFIKDELQA